MLLRSRGWSRGSHVLDPAPHDETGLKTRAPDPTIKTGLGRIRIQPLKKLDLTANFKWILDANPFLQKTRSHGPRGGAK